MTGIVWLCAFIALGIVMAQRIFSNEAVMVRAWLGSAMGFIMAMWLPTLLAFAMRFTVAAQWTALGVGAAITAAVCACVKPRKTLAEREAAPPWGAVLAVVIPLTIIGAYLQYTHNMRPVNGGYNVGQSTYSDINLHLSIVTGIRNAAFPPEYILLPGTRLCYPFLTDALSGSMYMLGTGISACLALPGTIMMGLVFLGYACIAWRLSGKRWITVLAVLMLFVNGGFGFIDMLDMVIKDPSRFYDIFSGYYMTPTNLPDLNLRWSNILVDMMVPQRTFLAGWTALLPALYLLIGATRSQEGRDFALTGIMAGCLPMINTHAFLALGLCSAGFMVWQIIHAGADGADGNIKNARRAVLRNYLIYGGIALAMALPQIFTWTLNQAAQGHFVKPHFNWVNNDGTQLIDTYFWFWIKNIGPAALFIIPALLDSEGEQRMIAVGSFVIFAVAELVVFQPLVYDNNKLYYVWYLLMLPVVLRYIQRLGHAMQKMRVRGGILLMGCFVLCSLLSGALTIGREWISDYQLYTAPEVEAMEYVDEHAPEDAVFLAGNQHNNAVSTLAGRRLVCGSDTFLYFHGLKYDVQQHDAYSMFTDPAGTKALFDKYGVDFIYMSAYERSQFNPDEALISEMYPLWYECGDIKIYAVSDRARASAAVN